MKDCKREGKKQCIWWVTGCLSPNVSPEMKIKCNKEGMWHETDKTDVVPTQGNAVQ
jgi:hypothetical protein